MSAKKFLSIPTLLSRGEDPLAGVTWEAREVNLQGGGKMTAEFPTTWSTNACSVFASHYLRVIDGVLEKSAAQAIRRLAGTVADWALADGYVDEAGSANLRAEVAALVVRQAWSPNSPAWYNIGTCAAPQLSACFIQSVEDSMESLSALQVSETNLSRLGSGTGTNLSPLRCRNAPLSSGGTASGAASFVRAFDAWAGVTKSGGKTRRAAKMVILNADYPDIHDFVREKAEAEEMAWDLVDAGWDASWNGKVYANLPFQNANNSVSASDEFMRRVERGEPWELRGHDGRVVRTIDARGLWEAVCAAAWRCGDPGLHFCDTINAWHTSPLGGRINASNPCSEYLFLDDSACNLASLNLKFFFRGGVFDRELFAHAVRVSILVQEVFVDRASYPTPRIAANSRKYRPLGLGYANLGALLMSLGIPYDSESGRAICAHVTSSMGAHAYAASAEIASVKGDAEGVAENAEGMRRVLGMHLAAARAAEEKYRGLRDVPFLGMAVDVWERVARGPLPRNAQTTVLAPTGTISFIMDCDTTGIEPDHSLVKYKTLAGGGSMRIVNQSVRPALERLGYTPAEVEAVLAHVSRAEKVEGAPGVRAEDLAVFDCASYCALSTPEPGTRIIKTEGHLLMMAAAQPFLSGAISKTVNLPHEATPADIGAAYRRAWELGLKAIAVYRDGCKASQPLAGAARARLNEKHPHVRRALDEVAAAAGLPAGLSLAEVKAGVAARRVSRQKLPQERRSLTRKFAIAGHDGYIHAGFYPDGRLGEVFVRMSKEGSTVYGLLDSWATAFSIALQHGAPLETLCEKGIGTTFAPTGFTGDDLRSASSVVDYVCRWLLRLRAPEPTVVGVVATAPTEDTPVAEVGAFLCPDRLCGGVTRQAGRCRVCERCGTSSGGCG